VAQSFQCSAEIDWLEDTEKYYPPTVNDKGAYRFAVEVGKRYLTVHHACALLRAVSGLMAGLFACYLCQGLFAHSPGDSQSEQKRQELCLLLPSPEVLA